MMKKLILIAVLTTWAYATSAYHGDITFEQADGSVFQGHLKGDEWFNWIESSSGDIIKYNISSKNYEYAEVKMIEGKTQLLPSGDKVGSLPTGTKSIDQAILKKIWTQKRTESLAHSIPKKVCH